MSDIKISFKSIIDSLQVAGHNLKEKVQNGVDKIVFAIATGTFNKANWKKTNENLSGIQTNLNNLEMGLNILNNQKGYFIVSSDLKENLKSLRTASTKMLERCDALHKISKGNLWHNYIKTIEKEINNFQARLAKSERDFLINLQNVELQEGLIKNQKDEVIKQFNALYKEMDNKNGKFREIVGSGKEYKNFQGFENIIKPKTSIEDIKEQVENLKGCFSKDYGFRGGVPAVYEERINKLDAALLRLQNLDFDYNEYLNKRY